MKTASALALVVTLAVQRVGVFAASYSFTPNPVGEKVYLSHLSARLAPALIVFCAFVVLCLIGKARRKARKSVPDDPQPHHG